MKITNSKYPIANMHIFSQRTTFRSEKINLWYYLSHPEAWPFFQKFEG